MNLSATRTRTGLLLCGIALVSAIATTIWLWPRSNAKTTTPTTKTLNASHSEAAGTKKGEVATATGQTQTTAQTHATDFGTSAVGHASGKTSPNNKKKAEGKSASDAEKKSPPQSQPEPDQNTDPDVKITTTTVPGQRIESSAVGVAAKEAGTDAPAQLVSKLILKRFEPNGDVQVQIACVQHGAEIRCPMKTRNVGGERHNFSPENFHFLDDQGNQYAQPGNESFTCDPQTNHTWLEAGLGEKGWVNCTVTIHQTKPVIGGAPTLTISFPYTWNYGHYQMVLSEVPVVHENL